MYQKAIIILKSNSKREILKLTQSGKNVSLELSENLNYPLTLLIDCGMEMTLNMLTPQYNFEGDLSGDISVVAISGNEVLFGANGKKDLSYILYENYKRNKLEENKMPNANDKEEKNEVVKEEKINIENVKTVQENNATDDNLKKSAMGESQSVENFKAKDNVTTENNGEKEKKEPTILLGGIEFNGDNFYQAIKPQLEEMFICYPIDSHLNERIPNSRWVRVDCDDEYYVVGEIFELSEVKFVCYGIPGKKDILPPDEIKDIAQFVEVDENYGIWMIFQDAKTGKCIQNNLNE